MTNSQLMLDYMVSLHFIDFISWGVLDNGPLYCITHWRRRQSNTILPLYTTGFIRPTLMYGAAEMIATLLLTLLPARRWQF
jgi:hypothetical protein